jgi:hypothetical protein
VLPFKIKLVDPNLAYGNVKNGVKTPQAFNFGLISACKASITPDHPDAELIAEDGRHTWQISV